MLLAMAVPAMAASEKKTTKAINVYRTIGRTAYDMPLAAVRADEVTKIKQTISFPGYAYPVDVYKAKGETTITVSEANPLLDVCLYKYDQTTGTKTLIGKADSQGTLTRAQAATVLYRLIDPSTRVDI